MNAKNACPSRDSSPGAPHCFDERDLCVFCGVAFYKGGKFDIEEAAGIDVDSGRDAKFVAPFNFNLVR